MDPRENISPVALTVITLVLSIATILVALRIYTRIFLLKQLGWDDHCIVVTMAFVIGTGGTVLSTIPYGLGRHTATLDTSVIPKYMFPFWLSIVLYNTTLALIKLTFLFQYYRLLAVHKMKRIIWISGTIIMAWAVSQILIVVFSCNPVAKFWRVDLPGSCIPNLPFWYINAAGNITTDLAIFAMPLPVLSKLQLRRKQKYFLLGIFSLGFFTCAISLIRLAYLNQGPDFTFDNVPTSCWSISELCCGVSCACLPTLKPLVNKIKPQWITSYGSRPTRHTGTSKRHYVKSDEEGTELKSTTRSRTTHESIKTTLSTANKNYAVIKENDLERGISVPLSPTHRQQERGRDGPGGVPTDGVAGPAMGWSEEDRHGAPKQSMPAMRLGKENKAMGVLGMTSVTTYVTSGRTSVPYSHPDSTTSPDTGESLTGIAVKRSVVVETIMTPTTAGIERTLPREF